MKPGEATRRGLPETRRRGDSRTLAGYCHSKPRPRWGALHWLPQRFCSGRPGTGHRPPFSNSGIEVEITPCSSWSDGFVPRSASAQRQPGLAWPRPQCEWPCGPRPARCGRAAREGPLHGGHRRRHGPTCQIDRPPIMIACESTNMAPPRSSGARACCFGVPWPTQRLPRAAERQAAGECARSAGPGPAASCALSCQCQPSPVRLAPVRGLDQPRTHRPTEHRPLRARRALGA